MDEQKSKFWNPREGDKLQGIFHGFTYNGKDDSGKAKYCMHVGELFVNMSAGIVSLLAPVYQNLKVGEDEITLIFVEKKKLKNGKPFKVFDVILNGKKLESFQASKEQLASLFELPK